jgi:hypothetical protein
MPSIADGALPVLALFQPAFSSAVFARAHLLAVAAILTTGRRTVSNLLRTVGHLAQGGALQLPPRPVLCPLVRPSPCRPAHPLRAAPLLARGHRDPGGR